MGADDLPKRKDALVLELPALQSTCELARIIVEAAPSGPFVIALKGNLGAGKTTFVQSVAQFLDIDEVVNSPTFTTMNEYHSGSRSLFHFDLYRVSEGQPDEAAPQLEMLAVEFDEICVKDNFLLLEWPEFFIVDGESYLNSLDHLEIHLYYPHELEFGGAGEEGRVACLTGRGSRMSSVLTGIESILSGHEAQMIKRLTKEEFGLF